MTFSRTTRTVRRLLVGLLAALVGAVAALAVGSLPAAAHDVMLESNPDDGAVLDTAPDEISFTFDQPLRNFEPVVNVFGPNGNSFIDSEPRILGKTVAADFVAGPAGEYRAVFRIVSSDGHPIAGQIIFSLTDAAAGDVLGTPVDDADISDDSADDVTADESGSDKTLWIIGTILLVIMVGISAVYTFRPKNKQRKPHRHSHGSSDN